MHLYLHYNHHLLYGSPMMSVLNLLSIALIANGLMLWNSMPGPYPFASALTAEEEAEFWDMLDEGLR